MPFFPSCEATGSNVVAPKPAGAILEDEGTRKIIYPLFLLTEDFAFA